MAIKRAQVIRLMAGAFRRGQSATSFLRDMKERGLSYRRTDMLSDWRSENQLETKKGLLQYVRKDYYPTVRVMAEQTYKLSHEYMYVIKVHSRLTPDAPITERMVNIMTDTPHTPEEIEQLAWDMIKEQSPKEVSKIEYITPWTAVHRIE